MGLVESGVVPSSWLTPESEPNVNNESAEMVRGACRLLDVRALEESSLASRAYCSFSQDFKQNGCAGNSLAKACLVI